MSGESKADVAFARLESLITQMGADNRVRLPPETELSEQFGLSRATVREALGRLEAAGRVERRRGRGTVVKTPQPVRYPANIIGSFSNFLDASGVPHEMLEFSLSRVEVDEHIASLLGARDGSRSAVRSVRSYALDGVPAAVLYHLLPIMIGERRLDVEKLRGDIVPFLESVHGVQIARVASSITAEESSDQVAKQLALKPRSPLLVMYTRVIDASDTTLALGALAFNPSVVSLGVEALEHVTAGAQAQFPTGWLHSHEAAAEDGRRKIGER